MIKYLLTICFIILSFAANAQIINVTNSTELQNALTAAKPGQTIVMKDGWYKRSGGFSIPAGIHGNESAPITLQGTQNAIISSDNFNTGYGLWLKGNNYWILDGFTVYKSKKGVMLDNSHHCLVNDLVVKNIGEEGVHLRTYSSFNKVTNCFVDSMGIVSGTAGTAEAIYIGSSTSNWTTYTSGNPDTCNYNTISGNLFGDYIPSENIDAKEGTSYGVISNNTFNGKGLNGANSGDSWLDLKGNYYKVFCNTGSNTMTDGFQTHILVSGWGDYNIFYDNNLTVGAQGYAVNIQTTGSKGVAANNIVCSNNKVVGASKGVSNITAKVCTESCMITGINIDFYEKDYIVYPNPVDEVVEIVFESMRDIASYSISNLWGIEIKKGNLSDALSRLDVAELPSGCYFITVDGSNKRMRFIKK